jgi:hypothetical protein
VPAQHGGDDGDRVGLEQISCHAGAVADVVADVVGDDRGVARVVLGDTGLDLAHEVRAHVGALGEDAAAESREDGDQRAAEAEADEGVQGLHGTEALEGQDPVIARDAQQAQADDQQAGDGAAAEGDLQGRIQALAGRLRGTDVGTDGDVHADEAGRAGQQRANGKTDGGRPVERKANDQEQRDADKSDGHVLALQIGACTLLDSGRDLAHAVVAGGLCHDPFDRYDAVRDRADRAGERKQQTE